jgi:hypothetical protein
MADRIDIPFLAKAASFYLADIAEGGLRKYWSEQKRLACIMRYHGGGFCAIIIGMCHSLLHTAMLISMLHSRGTLYYATMCAQIARSYSRTQPRRPLFPRRPLSGFQVPTTPTTFGFLRNKL